MATGSTEIGKSIYDRCNGDIRAEADLILVSRVNSGLIRNTRMSSLT